MPSYPLPTNPIGTYNPLWMHYDGTNWGQAWNTAIIGSPTQTGADVLANCVGWSEGRMLQLYCLATGYDPDATGTHPFVTFGYHNAGEWYAEAEALGFQTLDHPEEGTVLVTSSHVANVEQYDIGYGWLISESGYGSLPAWNLQYSIYESGGTWYSTYASDPVIIGFFKIPSIQPLFIGNYDRHRSRRYRYKK